MSRRPRTRRLLLPATLGAAAVAAGGTAVYAHSGGSGSTQYRTAVATLGSVTQTIALSGTLAPVGEVDLDFTSSGRVQSVEVHGGQMVTAGQVLASLDPTALQAALTQAQATLQSAQARLSLDEAGPTAQSLAQSQSQVRSAQAALLSAQTGLADARAVGTQTVAQAQAALTADQAALAADDARIAQDCSTPAASPAASPGTPGTPGSSDPCATDQQALSRDQAALRAAPGAITAARVRAQQADDQAQGQVASATVQLDNAQGALTALQQGTTAQQLQTDRGQVQVAQATLTNARTALQQATLTAPAAGVIGQVAITPGQTVGGGSAASSSGSPEISILTPGAFEVTGSVGDTRIDELAVGQRASVTTAGSPQPLQGRVATISPEATVTSGVASFPVTVTLDGSTPSLHAGAPATVSVVVDQVSQALTVPASAVHLSAGGASVQVLTGGVPRPRPITVGASDGSRAQVLSGLSPGDRVVIASLSSTVPTPSAGSLFGGRGGGGRAGGAGRTGAGGGLGG
jgi:RND family efflux transporter MFP subunit